MSDFIDIYINEREKKIPFRCNICNTVLQSIEDTMSAYNEGACRDCFISFVEMNKGMHGDGWVPSESEIKNWLNRKTLVYKPRYNFF